MRICDALLPDDPPRPLFLLGLAALATAGCAPWSGTTSQISATAAGIAEPVEDVESRFDTHWRDGRAELSGYRLTVTRYGEPRVGQASLIYVTEPFRERARVKADDPSKDPDDTFLAMKLNLSRDFQTGIYDYHTMTSVFVRSSDLSPAKITFTSTEWCGQVYHQLVFRAREVEQYVASYFEGESTNEPLPAGPEESGAEGGALSEDGLFVALRGLKGDLLAPGESRVFPFLPALFVARLTHAELAWTTAEVERSPGSSEVRVPAGVFACDRYQVRVADGRVGSFDVERAYPRRIIRWSWTRDSGAALDAADAGELLGTVRRKYWELNGPGGEEVLKDLGLSPIAGGS